MDRLKIPSGTVQRLEDIFDRMQEFIKDNILRRFVTITANEGLELFSSHGPVTDQLYGVIQSSTELKVLLVNGLNFSIQPGTAMLENGELIRVSSVINAETSADADTYYLVSLVYDEAGSVPITAQVAFVYDKTVASPYSTKNTEFTDSYVVTLTEIGDSGAVLPAANELPLAIIQTNDTGLALLATNWTRLGVTAANGVIDLRATYSLKLNHDLLDDSTVLFKDRASTGDNKVDQNIEFSQTTTLSGPVAMTGGGTNTSIPGISNSIFMLGQGVLGPGGAGLQVATLADLLDPLTFQEAAATRGTILVVRTGGELYEDTLVGTSGTPEFTIRVSDPPTGGQPLTVSGLSVIDNGSTETWCEVTAVSGHNETYNYWEFTADWRDGVQDITYDSGTAVAEYGVSGDGGIKITANASPPEGTAPFIDIFTIDNEPWNGLTIEGRFGNYKGFLGESSIRYGIAIGDTDSYLTYNKIDGLKIKSDFEFIGAASFSGTILIGTGAATEQIHLAGTGTDTTTQLYTGAGVYGGSSTGVYIDASGRFSLGETLK